MKKAKLKSRKLTIFFVGKGGREHALVHKACQSPEVDHVWCAPGNAGIARESTFYGHQVECVAIEPTDIPHLLLFALEKEPDITVVSSDDPLAIGIVDTFKNRGLRIWGPPQSGAILESSKVFAQKFMERHNIPTPYAGWFHDFAAAKRFAKELNGDCVVKADGLSLGKGVLVCRDIQSAYAAIVKIMANRAFGDAGNKIVIQKREDGEEMSLHAFCDGTTAKLMPSSRDYKMLNGMQTGGMGGYSPTDMTRRELADLGKSVISPWLLGCQEEGIDFRGVIYPGVILTREGPKVLEFNARFGDPETQLYLTRLVNDIVEILEATIDGTLQKINLGWREECAVCVVLAAEGYPEAKEYEPVLITGLEQVAKEMPDVKVFHAGTEKRGEKTVVNVGRVVGVTALKPTRAEARARAYEAADIIRFRGKRFLPDIAL